MNGAQALLRTLVDGGVDVCFANPGTSEMHLVAALDDTPGLRGVLTLFEGVATGAADGYGRMADRPAAALLHLGPGLANGLANLHNARRARTPLLALVGDHATFHHRFDAPLQSDIAALARTVSVWERTSSSADRVGADAAEAVAASFGPPAGVATLIVPADVSWSETTTGPASPRARADPVSPSTEAVERAGRALREAGDAGALLLGGAALREGGLLSAARVAAATGARLFGETFPSRIERGVGLPQVERLPYLPEMVEGTLSGVRSLVLAGAASPVSFFAYPGRASDLVTSGCTVETLATPDEDVGRALRDLAGVVHAGAGTSVVGATPIDRPGRPSGALNAASFAAAIGYLLPEGAVVADESNTSGLQLPAATAGCPPHDWLALTGGAIGQGLPLATGAALGAPGRKVLCLEADGSAMYTVQALWTQARAGLDVTTVVLVNRAYAILQFELARIGAGPRASAMLELSPPTIDFVALAGGLGVPAWRATTADELCEHLARGLATEGPALIEAIL